MSDFELWKGKRWVISAFLFAYFAALSLEHAFSLFQFSFISARPAYLIGLLPALTLAMIIFKLIYFSQAHFIRLEKLESNQFAWFSDVIFIAIFYLILMKVDFLALPRSLEYAPEFSELFGFYIGLYFTAKVIWQIFVQFTVSLRDGITEGSTLEQIWINLLTGAAVFALTFLRIDTIDQPTSLILIFGVLTLSLIIEFLVLNKRRVIETETLDEETHVETD